MLEGIRVTNFKCLRDVDLSFPRLTLLFGPNSSGKSSLFQMLLAIKQTLESRNPLVPLILSGRYVQLGSYENIVYGKDSSRCIGVEFRIKSPRLERMFYRRGSAYYQRPDRVNVQSTFDSAGEAAFDFSTVTLGFKLEFIKSTRRVRLKETWVSDAKHTYVVRMTRKALTGLVGKEVNYPIKGRTVVIAKHRFEAGIRYFIPDLRLQAYRTPTEPDARVLSSLRFLQLRIELENQFSRNLLYLGPLRDYPRRYYLTTGEVPKDIGLKGETVVEMLYYDSRLRKRKTKQALMDGLKHWLQRFSLAKNVRIDSLPEGLYSLTLQDPQTGFQVNLADTGFGASQIMPVIVECLSSPEQSTVMIEQPEIHVHPRIQAELADLFVEASKGRQVIIETHSEHILLRIQRRIAEGALSNNDVALYFFEPSSEGTRVHKLELDKTGSLTNWPKGFFEEDYQESLARYKVLAEKNRSDAESK